jgi:hypothetical protein
VRSSRARVKEAQHPRVSYFALEHEVDRENHAGENIGQLARAVLDPGKGVSGEIRGDILELLVDAAHVDMFGERQFLQAAQQLGSPGGQLGEELAHVAYHRRQSEHDEQRKKAPRDHEQHQDGDRAPRLPLADAQTHDEVEDGHDDDREQGAHVEQEQHFAGEPGCVERGQYAESKDDVAAQGLPGGAGFRGSFYEHAVCSSSLLERRMRTVPARL